MGKEGHEKDQVFYGWGIPHPLGFIDILKKVGLLSLYIVSYMCLNKS